MLLIGYPRLYNGKKFVPKVMTCALVQLDNFLPKQMKFLVYESPFTWDENPLIEQGQTSFTWATGFNWSLNNCFSLDEAIVP